MTLLLRKYTLVVYPRSRVAANSACLRRLPGQQSRLCGVAVNKTYPLCGLLLPLAASHGD